MLERRIFKKLKFEFLAELCAKQYAIRYKLGHVSACKISYNHRKKNPLFNHESILSKRSVQNFIKIGALVFKKSYPPTLKIQF